MDPDHREAISRARKAGEAAKPKEVREVQNKKIGEKLKATLARKREEKEKKKS